MSPPDARDAEGRFAALAARFLEDPEVSEGTGFGSNPGLRVGGKIFAMLVRGELVVKLPRGRVDQLVESGRGARFDPGHGRLMKEWAAVPADRRGEWDALAGDAFAFVSSTLPRAKTGSDPNIAG